MDKILIRDRLVTDTKLKGMQTRLLRKLSLSQQETIDTYLLNSSARDYTHQKLRSCTKSTKTNLLSHKYQHAKTVVSPTGCKIGALDTMAAGMILANAKHLAPSTEAVQEKLLCLSKQKIHTAESLDTRVTPIVFSETYFQVNCQVSAVGESLTQLGSRITHLDMDVFFIST